MRWRQKSDKVKFALTKKCEYFNVEWDNDPFNSWNHEAVIRAADPNFKS